jgi:hypothetical protein
MVRQHLSPARCTIFLLLLMLLIIATICNVGKGVAILAHEWVTYVCVNKQLASFRICFGVVFWLSRERFKIRIFTACGRNIPREPVLSLPELSSPGSDFVIGCSSFKQDVFANHICDHIVRYWPIGLRVKKLCWRKLDTFFFVSRVLRFLRRYSYNVK